MSKYRYLRRRMLALVMVLCVVATVHGDEPLPDFATLMTSLKEDPYLVFTAYNTRLIPLAEAEIEGMIAEIVAHPDSSSIGILVYLRRVKPKACAALPVDVRAKIVCDYLRTSHLLFYVSNLEAATGPARPKPDLTEWDDLMPDRIKGEQLFGELGYYELEIDPRIVQREPPGFTVGQFLVEIGPDALPWLRPLLLDFTPVNEIGYDRRSERNFTDTRRADYAYFLYCCITKKRLRVPVDLGYRIRLYDQVYREMLKKPEDEEPDSEGKADEETDNGAIHF